MEVGYTLGLKQYKGYELRLQPQLQTIWQGVKADKHIENNGTQVTGNKDNLQTRLGARVMLVSIESSDSVLPIASPYLEANWLHNTRDYSVTMGNESISQAGTKNIAEIKAGVKGHFTGNTSLWLNIGHQFSNDSYKDTTATVGINYSF